MKLLLAVHHFPPRFTSGAEGYAYRVASEFQTRGHQVKVVCVEYINASTDGEISWLDDLYDGINVHRLSYNLENAPDRFRWEYDNPWIGEHLEKWLQEEKPDLFHQVGGYIMSASALRAAKKLGIPIVITLVDFWYLCPRINMLRSDRMVSKLPLKPEICAQCLGEEKRRYRWLGILFPQKMKTYWSHQREHQNRILKRQNQMKESLNWASAIISPSEFVRATYIKAGMTNRISFIRHGRNFPHLTPENIQKKPSDILRIGFIGQIAWHKGVHIILESLRYLPSSALSLKIYGDDKAFPEYTGRIKKLALSKSAKMAGKYQSSEVLTTILQELDVIVVPSLWYENCPYVILEAFAHRTPVIASNLGGMAELVQHGKNGLLFKPGDSIDLARQIKRLLDEPELLASLVAGIEPIKNLAQEMDELEVIYNQLVIPSK